MKTSDVWKLQFKLTMKWTGTVVVFHVTATSLVWLQQGTLLHVTNSLGRLTRCTFATPTTPSIILTLTGGAGAYPSCHWERGEVHPGQVYHIESYRDRQLTLTLNLTPTTCLWKWGGSRSKPALTQKDTWLTYFLSEAFLKNIFQSCKTLKKFTSPPLLKSCTQLLLWIFLWDLMSCQTQSLSTI